MVYGFNFPRQIQKGDDPSRQIEVSTTIMNRCCEKGKCAHCLRFYALELPTAATLLTAFYVFNSVTGLIWLKEMLL